VARITIDRNDFSWNSHFDGQAVFGADLENFSAKDNGMSSTEKKNRLHIPLGGSATVTMGDLKTTLGAVGHYYHYDFRGNTVFEVNKTQEEPRDYFFVSPRMGSRFSLTQGIEIRATGGKYYRAPAMRELYGSPLGVAPSLTLKPESAWKGDIGVDGEFSFKDSWLRNTRFSATLFTSRSENLITYLKNAQQAVIAINIGESEIWGEELLTEWNTSFDLSLRMGVSLLQTRNVSAIAAQFGKKLPGRPDYRIQAGLQWDNSVLGLGYFMVWNGPYYWDLVNSTEMQPWMEHSVSLSIRPKGWGTFLIEGKNLGDVISVISQTGTNSVVDNTTGFLGYPAPGRRVFLTWQYEI
jgi:outer membrane receptor protein involved in Fe transport